MKSLLTIVFSILLVVSCNVETPIDLQSQVVNQNSFKYTQDNVQIYKTLSQISTKPILPYPTMYAYSISPPLPNGLSLNAYTGEIIGVPTNSTPAVVYTITAQNSIERIYSSIKISILEQPITSFNYVLQSTTTNTALINGFEGLSIIPLEPVTTGGTPESFEISIQDEIALNSIGLSFSTIGVISGTPTNYTPVPFTITVTARNQSSNVTKKIYVNIKEQAPTSIGYSNLTPSVGGNIAPVFPVITGGVPSSFEIKPDLPNGLVMNTTTGVISGTPTQNQSLTTYTVFAKNTGGEVTTTFTIQITDVAPTGLDYGLPTPLFGVTQFIKNDVVVYLTPFLATGTPTNYTISPQLPLGLEFNSTTGVISGVPIAVSTRTTYTVYAINLYGTTSVSFDLQVIEVAPTNINYALSTLYTVGVPITPILPTYNGSAATTFKLKSSSNSLPAGLVLNSSTGELSGTPQSAYSNYQITILANNNANSTPGTETEIVLTFTIYDKAPIGLVYNNVLPLKCNYLMVPLFPSFGSTSGAPSSYQYNSSQITLPNGISFDSLTGLISGTPTVATPPIQMIISGTNLTGTTSTQLNLRVYPEIPVFNYTASQLFAGSSGQISPTLTHCAFNEQFYVNKQLPDGITFDPLTGNFNVNSFNKNLIMHDDYTVTAKNKGVQFTNTNGITSFNEVDQLSNTKIRIGVDYIGTSDSEIVFSDFINFNNDEFSDILIVEKKCPLLCTNAVIKVFLGSANGAFKPHSFSSQTIDESLDLTEVFAGVANPPIYFNIKKVKSVYFNDGDFLTDLVLIEENSNTVIFLKNNQNDISSPRTFKHFGHTSAPSNVNDIAIIDTDQDEIPEVLVSDTGNNLNIYKFNPMTTAYDIRVLKQFYQLKGVNDGVSSRGVGSIASFETLDVNSDGLFDLVIADGFYKRICFILGTGNNVHFEDSCIHVIEPNKSPIDLKSDDLDGDGIMDIVLLLASGTLEVYRGDGDSFQIFSDIPSTPNYRKDNIVTNPTSDLLRLGDTNGDCIKDIQVMDKANNRIINMKISTATAEFQIPQYMNFQGISKFTVGSRYTDPMNSSFMLLACNEQNNYCSIPEHIGNQPDASPNGCSFPTDGGSDDGGTDGGEEPEEPEEPEEE